MNQQQELLASLTRRIFISTLGLALVIGGLSAVAKEESYQQLLRTAEELQMLPTCRELTQSDLSNNIARLTLRHSDKPCNENCAYQSIIDKEGRQVYLLLKRTCRTGTVFWFCLPCLEDGVTKTLQLRLIESKPQVMGQECPACR